MASKKQILGMIKQTVKGIDPGATVILYGSYARGDNKKASDIDILILIDKMEVTLSDERRIKYPLYDIEFDTGKVISPLVLSRHDWETRHKITPFYENVKREGIAL